MKTPIEPSDIKAGDLIRKEYGCEIVNGETALEYRATCDAHGKGGPGTHYLLDRPKPPVVLPTEPTLGWLTTTTGMVILDHWCKDGRYVHRRVEGRTKSLPLASVVAFTEAVPVPAIALERLRSEHRATQWETKINRGIVSSFFAEVKYPAIDKAATS